MAFNSILNLRRDIGSSNPSMKYQSSGILMASFFVGVSMAPLNFARTSATESRDPRPDYLNLAVLACLKAPHDVEITFDEVKRQL